MDQVSKQGPIFRVFPIPAGPWAGGGKDPSRASHKTFDAYCWERWGFAKPYAVRMIGALRAKISENDRDRWFVSDFEKATTLPFEKIWHQVNYPVVG